ncbi:hypothetical protein Tco_0343172 [Tanacetum coccineum]
MYMFADTPYPLSAQLMKKMLKHKLEVEIDGIGNDMTYAEQLIQFIKNQFSMDLTLSGSRLDADCLVAGSTNMKVAFGVGFKMLLFNPLLSSRFVVPTGRVKVLAGVCSSYWRKDLSRAGPTVRVGKVVNSWQNCSQKYGWDVSKNGRALNMLYFHHRILDTSQLPPLRIQLCITINRECCKE